MTQYIEPPVKLLVYDKTGPLSIEVNRGDKIDLSSVKNLISEDIVIKNDKYYILIRQDSVYRVEIYDMNFKFISRHTLGIKYYAYQVYNHYIYYLTYDDDLYRLDVITDDTVFISTYNYNIRDFRIINDRLYITGTKGISIVSTATNEEIKFIKVSHLSFYSKEDNIFIGIDGNNIAIFDVDTEKIRKIEVKEDRAWINILQTDNNSNYYFNSADSKSILIYNLKTNKVTVKTKNEHIQNSYRSFSGGKGHLLIYFHGDLYILNENFDIIRYYIITALGITRDIKIDSHGRILIRDDKKIVILTHDYHWYAEVKMDSIRINLEKYNRADIQKMKDIIYPVISSYLSMNVVGVITKFL